MEHRTELLTWNKLLSETIFKVQQTDDTWHVKTSIRWHYDLKSNWKPWSRSWQSCCVHGKIRRHIWRFSCLPWPSRWLLGKQTNLGHERFHVHKSSPKIRTRETEKSFTNQPINTEAGGSFFAGRPRLYSWHSQQSCHVPGRNAPNERISHETEWIRSRYPRSVVPSDHPPIHKPLRFMGLSTSHQSQTGPRWPERVINCPGAGGQQGAATPEVKWSLYPIPHSR